MCTASNHADAELYAWEAWNSLAPYSITKHCCPTTAKEQAFEKPQQMVGLSVFDFY